MQVAFFLDGKAGSLFCFGAQQATSAASRGRVLLVPPFAEEMNKSRHVLSAMVRGLGEVGFDVLLPDLFGTGDSEGDFSAATLAIWRADLDRAIDALPGPVPLYVVGLRAGALLAVDAAARHEVHRLLLLQPQIDGRQVLNQLIRLRLAGGLMGDGEKETAAQLRERLASGDVLEIAGYGLSPQMAADLEALVLDRMPPPGVAHVDWVEVVPQDDRPVMPASQRLIERWQGAGLGVRSEVIACDPFWATQEIARCPGLARRVVDRLLA